MVPGYSEISIFWFGDPIRAERLMTGLDEPSRRRLGTIMQNRHVDKGQIIFSAKTVPTEVIIIRKGTAELVGAISSRTVSEGEVFGLTETLAGAQFVDTLTAVTGCEISGIGRDDLIWYLRQTPEACYRSLEVVAECLHNARKKALGDN